MKKILIACVLMTALSSTNSANAGFWGSIAGSALGNAISKGHSEERMSKVNTYLWNMHLMKNVRNKEYEEGYIFYLNYLEQAEDIMYLDTVAQVYNDNGDNKKAIEIYEKRILPWVVIEDDRTKEEYKEKYEKLKGIKREVKRKSRR